MTTLKMMRVIHSFNNNPHSHLYKQNIWGEWKMKSLKTPERLNVMRKHKIRKMFYEIFLGNQIVSTPNIVESLEIWCSVPSALCVHVLFVNPNIRCLILTSCRPSWDHWMHLVNSNIQPKIMNHLDFQPHTGSETSLEKSHPLSRPLSLRLSTEIERPK